MGKLREEMLRISRSPRHPVSLSVENENNAN